MAVVTTKSTQLTNRDATPRALTDPFIGAGSTTEGYGWVTANAGDSIGSFYKMMQVPSNCRLTSLRLACANLGTGVTVDVGAFYPPVIPQGGGQFLNGALAGTLVGGVSSQIAPGLAASAAIASFQDVISTANMSLAQQEMPLWQMLGLSADPEVSFDIGYVVRGAAVGTTGQIAMKAIYIF